MTLSALLASLWQFGRRVAGWSVKSWLNRRTGAPTLYLFGTGLGQPFGDRNMLVRQLCFAGC